MVFLGSLDSAICALTLNHHMDILRRTDSASSYGYVLLQVVLAPVALGILINTFLPGLSRSVGTFTPLCK
jgi:hypothetical protein